MKNNHFKRLNIKKWDVLLLWFGGVVVHKFTVQTAYVKTDTNRNTGGLWRVMLKRMLVNLIQQEIRISKFGLLLSQ